MTFGGGSHAGIWEVAYRHVPVNIVDKPNERLHLHEIVCELRPS